VLDIGLEEKKIRELALLSEPTTFAPFITAEMNRLSPQSIPVAFQLLLNALIFCNRETSS
jgi:hypothetical protein